MRSKVLQNSSVVEQKAIDQRQRLVLAMRSDGMRSSKNVACDVESVAIVCNHPARPNFFSERYCLQVE